MTIRTKALQSFIASALVALSLSGCGGGGGSDHSSGGGTTTGVPVQSTTRTLVDGLAFNYKVTGTITQGGATKDIRLGTRQVTYATDSTNGATFSQSTVEGLFTDTDGFSLSRAQTIDVNQVAARDFVLTGVSGTATTTTPTIVPGIWSVGRTLNVTAAIQNGGRFTQTFEIQGLDTPTGVPLGNYQAYKVRATYDDGSGDTVSGTYWYVPQLGGYVRSEETITTPTASAQVVAVATSVDAPVTQ